MQEVENFNQRRIGMTQDQEGCKDAASQLKYLSHVRTYPTFMFGGSVGSRVATVAFLRN